MSINAIKRLDEIDVKVERLVKQKKDGERELIKCYQSEHKTVWRIKATPNLKNHCKHYVDGCFDSEKKARAVSGNGSRHDYDDNCSWVYTLPQLPLDHPKVHDSTLLKMNTTPTSFPY